jgi:hypothetical protein
MADIVSKNIQWLFAPVLATFVTLLMPNLFANKLGQFFSSDAPPGIPWPAEKLQPLIKILSNFISIIIHENFIKIKKTGTKVPVVKWVVLSLPRSYRLLNRI